MVGYKDHLEGESIFQKASIHLIDYGLTAKFMKNGKLLKQYEIDHFRGNMMFASVNQLKFLTTSRVDDLMSLCYMLVYLLNNKNLYTNVQGNNREEVL